MAKTLLFNKPFRVMSQFSAVAGKETLADYVKIAKVYPAGRLDFDSEGLMLLTDDGALQAKITHPKHKQAKAYLLQVDGLLDSSALTALQQGVVLKDGLTLPAKAKVIEPPAWLWPRHPPIRERKTIPTQWLEIEIREGRNRQLRRMTAAVGHPTLRVVRIRIGQWQLGQLQPGEFRSLN